MHARFGQRNGADLSKAPGIMARIITDGAAKRQTGAGQPCGQSLRSAAHGKDVHSVCADAHNAADAAGAKLQLVGKTALDGLLIVGKLLELFQVAFAERRGFAPDLVTFNIIHGFLSLDPLSDEIRHLQ